MEDELLFGFLGGQKNVLKHEHGACAAVVDDDDWSPPLLLLPTKASCLLLAPPMICLIISSLLFLCYPLSFYELPPLTANNNNNNSTMIFGRVFRSNLCIIILSARLLGSHHLLRSTTVSSGRVNGQRQPMNFASNLPQA